MWFFYDLVLIVLTKFVPNSNTNRRYSSGVIYSNFGAKLGQNLMEIAPKNNLHHCIKSMLLRCQKDAGIKMH